jgi:hypothetical protein
VSEHESSDLRAIGALVREMQGELRALGINLDLLSRGRERDLTTFGTRDDMHDLIDVLTDRLTGFDQRISEAVAQVAERLDSHDKMLTEILDRLPPKEAAP